MNPNLPRVIPAPEKLKPCPFCGCGTPHLIEVPLERNRRTVKRWVECPACYSTSGFLFTFIGRGPGVLHLSKFKLVESWNTRPLCGYAYGPVDAKGLRVCYQCGGDVFCRKTPYTRTIEVTCTVCGEGAGGFPSVAKARSTWNAMYAVHAIKDDGKIEPDETL